MKIALCAVLIAGAFPLFGQAADPSAGGGDIAGFPAFRSVRMHLLPPVIDGVITDGLPEGVKADTGWRAAARITLSNGVTVPDAAFQSLKEADGDFLDLSFEVRHDPSLDEGDAVVLGLRPIPGDAPAGFQDNDLVIIVYPFAGKDDAAAVPAGGTPSRVEIWKYAGDGWKDVSAEVKGCFWAARAFAATEDSFGWDLECRIPAGTAKGGDAWVDLPDRFYLYWNVVRVQSGPMPTVSQFAWPRRCPPLSGSLEPDALSPAGWGRADMFDAAVHKGLWIDPAGITVAREKTPETPEDFTIVLDAFVPSLHDFTAVVLNEATRVTGTYEDYMTEENVSVTFRSADWGIAGPNPGPDWKPLEETFAPEKGSANPTKPLSIPPAQSPTMPGSASFTYKSSIGPQAPAGITTVARRCLYAEISAPAGTYFREPGAYRNMIFSRLPELEERAVVSVRGYGPLPEGKSAFTYLLRTEKKIWMKRKAAGLFSGPETLSIDGSEEQDASDINSYFEWTLHGFLLTGEILTVRGRSYAAALPTGSFGYRVNRPTEVLAWRESVGGAKALDKTTYVLEMAADDAAEITTGIKTEESTGLFFGARAGGVVPVSLAAGGYIIGPSACLEAGIKFTQILSFLLNVGYAYLLDPAGGAGHHMFSALIGIRAAIEFSPVFYMYLQGGAFGYTPDFAVFDLGVDMGLAAGINLSRDLALEAGVNYYLGFLTADGDSLLRTNVGLILRF
ncbi:MAG: hypothetical protein JXD23_01795 [Spirochaetales bacterium]|nr:hypothetical protein [Spirochaetales bacterium]